MTEYDLREWQDKTTTIATINIAEAKFETWRTRILFAAANADENDAHRACKELLFEMMTDTFQLWESGIKGSLAVCVRLYNKVWTRLRILFRVIARVDILERDGFMKAFTSAAKEITEIMIVDSGKERTE